MRIWGYVLIVLNIGAAGAFTYFATAVWNKRLEWQYALLKQELTNVGLPLEPPAVVPDDLDEGSVPFSFQVGSYQIDQLSKQRLKKLVPQGGDVLGQKGGEPIANQTDEVARVEKIVFGDLDSIKDPAEKRSRLLILLLNLSPGTSRTGVYALLRDWPDPKLDEGKKERSKLELFTKEDFEQSRYVREAPLVGRSPKQALVLRALAAVADANSALAGKANLSPEKVAERSRAARREIGMWLQGEIPGATPDAWVPVNPPTASDEPPAKNEERERYEAAVKLLQDEIVKDAPNPAQVKTGVDRIKELAEGENALKSAAAKEVVPYLVAVGGNLLGTPEDVQAAKAKLVELLAARSSTESEKKAMAALADMMIPPDLKLPADTPLDKVKEAQDAAFEKNRETAALELLRSYFEEAKAKPATSEKLPEDIAQARSMLAAKSLPSPGEKRRLIAHLLYHLDAHLGSEKERRDDWHQQFLAKKGEKADENIQLPPVDAQLLENRAKWHQRVAAVVGLEQYIAVTEEQASQFFAISEDIRKHLIEEQNGFLNRYRQIIVRITKDLADKLDRWNGDVAFQQKVLEANKLELNKELEAKKKLEDELAVVSARTKAALSDLDAKANDLFQVTKKLGEAQDALLGLEMQIRDLESGKISRGR